MPAEAESKAAVATASSLASQGLSANHLYVLASTRVGQGTVCIHDLVGTA